MIKYTLRCEAGHEFEAWFNSMAGFDEQKERGYLSCAICGSERVDKAIMAPRIRTSERAAPEPATGHTGSIDFEDVGDTFVQEVRDIHEGLAESRNITGKATEAEIKGLEADGLADGVVAIKLPTRQ